VTKELREPQVLIQGVQYVRRIKSRFSIQQPVRYTAVGRNKVRHTGVGNTVNISSAGVCFTTETTLPVHTFVEMSMDWPVLLNGLCPMKLVIIGRVIRSSNEWAVVAIKTSAFHTRSARLRFPAAQAGEGRCGSETRSSA
jgi:hypothetical protein